jgi:hypothetical protein
LKFNVREIIKVNKYLEKIEIYKPRK